MVVGLLVTAQLKSKPQRPSSTPLSNYTLLKENQENLTKEQADLKNQISLLQNQILDIGQKLKKTQSSSRQQVDQLAVLKDKTGLTELRGKGVVITLDDSAQFPASSNSIAHAADMRDLVNFLWTQGVSGIAINNERIVASTSIDCIVNTVMINNTKMTTPFVMSVVSDNKDLKGYIEKNDNLTSIWQRVKNEGLKFAIIESDNIILPVYKGSLVVDYAQLQ
ncbi:MAG: hypothetical protein COX39_01240 [Candidatus Nealsonbacteria bacterium CG23_combo_of_CG06-09_8_20_14_all_40_13]|uniref:DUF881 domain-containing protein n=1 Tax=Candidatus Nealsonbacteria bacterium CG23_combo_of_CG06-09_8_20_14_all_40_13 TaxID=1974724 RepID=A0A2G9YR97_9BACT|nr:MAG: hypothetical protein COX39_01240 [Candidatus Nealsonbacteria bacterium CG23_combo_of_CG06-09_8_20_14_all_40_13]